MSGVVCQVGWPCRSGTIGAAPSKDEGRDAQPSTVPRVARCVGRASPAIASARAESRVCLPVPPLGEPWSYAQAHTLAVRTNTWVPELPPPQLPWTPPILPAFDPAKMGATLRQRFPELRQHFVFEYYPWYSTDPWWHWNQWQRVPPFDIAATSVPRLGPYDSRDAKVIEQHARWILDAGVGAINLSWWGRGSFEDQRVPLVMDVMRDHGLKVTFHLEPVRARSEPSGTRTTSGICLPSTARSDAGTVGSCSTTPTASKGQSSSRSRRSSRRRGPTVTVGRFRWISIVPIRSGGSRRTRSARPSATTSIRSDCWPIRAPSIGCGRRASTGWRFTITTSGRRSGRTWPSIAANFGVEFSFNINAGFDSIAQRNVPPDSCYRPPRFEPPAVLDWSAARDREHRTATGGMAHRRVDAHHSEPADRPLRCPRRRQGSFSPTSTRSTSGTKGRSSSR